MNPKMNRFDPRTGSLGFTAGQTNAYEELVPYYTKRFRSPLRASDFARARSPNQTRQNSYFRSSHGRLGFQRRRGPGITLLLHENNWPPEPLVHNTASSETVGRWSARPS